MGGAGTYYLGGKYNYVWAALAPIAGAGGIAEGTAERFKSLPTLIMHGAKDSIVPPANSRRAVAALQAAGAPHLYLEFPDKDHEFWIRRGHQAEEEAHLLHLRGGQVEAKLVVDFLLAILVHRCLLPLGPRLPILV